MKCLFCSGRFTFHYFLWLCRNVSLGTAHGGLFSIFSNIDNSPQRYLSTEPFNSPEGSIDWDQACKRLGLLALLFYSNHAVQWESSHIKAMKGQVVKRKLGFPSSSALRWAPFHKTLPPVTYMLPYMASEWRLKQRLHHLCHSLWSTIKAPWAASFSTISVQLISEVASVRLSTLF